MPAVKALCLALGLQAAGALRRFSSRHGKAVAGVPILNYRYRHLQIPEVGKADGTFDWVLKFQSTVADQQIADFCGGACRSIGHPSRGGLPIAIVRATEEELEKMLKESSAIEWVEPDTPVELEEPRIEETMPENSLWGLETIGLERAGFNGEGVHIYVMDTGIRASHSDFGGRAIPTIQATSDIVDECNGDLGCATDTAGHGTHCAGTAGGQSYGVAKAAFLHAMHVCCYQSSIPVLAGIDWLTQNRILPAVMTMSLGGSLGVTPEAQRLAVDAVVASGVTVTVSAGNQGTPSCDKTYTFIRSAIGVGASDSNNARASWSNYGECNAIFAPGVSIVSASHTSDTGTATMSGTSMACPHVAGVSALLLQQDPSRVPEKVREQLRGRAQRDELSGLLPGDPNLLLWAGDEVAPTPVPTPAPPTPAPGTWELEGSGCVMDGNCIHSLNYPSNYGNQEACSVKLWGSIPLAFESFATEAKFDNFQVGGASYSGELQPPFAGLNGEHTGRLTWASDYSVTNTGWKFCRTGV